MRKNKPDQTGPKAPGILFLWLILPLVVVSVVAQIWIHQELDKHQRRVARAHEVESAIGRLLATMIDAETGQRGYLLTGQEHYLQPYFMALRLVEDNFARLKQLTRNNPRQQDRLQELDGHIDLKLQELAETIALFQKGQKAKSLDIVLSDYGKREMDTIRVLLDDMKDEEIRLLGTWAGDLENRKVYLVAIDGGSILLFVLLLLYFVVSRNNYQRELVIARNDAIKANEAKTGFLATMSHELRTPMTAVLGFSELLLEEQVPEKARSKVTGIRDAAIGLLGIINDVLDVSKLETGQIQLLKTDFRLQGLADEVVTLFDGNNPHVSFRTQFTTDFPYKIHGDETRIRQVLINLTSNADRFTEEGTITVAGSLATGETGQPYLFVTVADTGIGMTSEMIEEVFSAYTREDPSVSRKDGGKGLGLWISKQIVEGMGGRIGCDSELGTGSVFWFRIPYESPKGVEQLPLTDYQLHAGEGQSVLVAEDNKVNQVFVETCLLQRGYQVTFADDGLQAVALATEKVFDIILMDVHMPNLDGVEATRRIRLLPDARGQVPIIAVTADAVQDHVNAYLEAGMNDAASKPYDWPHLLALMHKYLDKRDGSMSGDRQEKGD